MLVYQRVYLYLYLYPISICMPLYPNTFEPILTYQPGSGRESYWIARQLFTEVSISSTTFSIPRPSLAYGMYALRNEHWWWTVISSNESNAAKYPQLILDSWPYELVPSWIVAGFPQDSFFQKDPPNSFSFVDPLHVSIALVQLLYHT